jgi:hypothetical protein
MSTDQPDSDADPTLYDPPAEHAETMPSENEGETVALEVPKELAHQLLEVAQHLGLHPDIVASRAIGLICDEVGLAEKRELTSGALIQKYQSRLDILHSADYDIQEEVAQAEQDRGEGADEFGWEDVDQIIEEGERSAPAGQQPSLATEERATMADDDTGGLFPPERPTDELDQTDSPADEEPSDRASEP